MVEGIASSWVPSYARGLNILLVDHDKASLTYLGSMLEQYSYTVTTAVLATDALAMIQQEKGKFKLVIASVNMPDMDNVSFLRQLLRNELPVILIAPERSVSAAVKALGEGAAFYLDKPISMDDLKYIWQHVFTTKRKREMEEHGNPNHEENTKIAKISKERIIKEMLNNASTTTTTRGQIKHYISTNKGKDLEPPNTPFRSETTEGCNDPKGKGKLVAEDESNKKDPGTLSNEMGMDISHVNDRPNGSKDNENGGANVQGEGTGNGRMKKKPRVVWSPDLHLKFIAAVSKLGDKKARPKFILEAMKVPGLTHRQVASHLQKFKTQVDKIFKAGERMDEDTLSYHNSRFLKVSNVLQNTDGLVRALENRTSGLIAQGLVSSGNVPYAINQTPCATFEAFPTPNTVPGASNFQRDFHHTDVNLDMNALEAFFHDSTPGHMNNAGNSLKSFGGVNAVAAMNFSSGTKPNAESQPFTGDYLVDFCEKNPEFSAMEVTYNIDSSLTGKQPLSDFTELLNALEEGAQGHEGQANEPTQGDIDRYCELLANVLIGGSPKR